MPPVSQSLMDVCFKNSAWVGSLDAENIVGYFCDMGNPFYDQTSDNEQARVQLLQMQQMGQGHPAMGMDEALL